MRKLFLLPLVLALSLGAAFGQASPYNLFVFKAQSFTATGQTGAAIQLNGLVIPTTVGSSYASGTITVTGVALTTVSFQVMGSSDNGATFYLLPVYAVASPNTPPVTTVTATGPGLYQVNLAGLTHIKLVTTGTFTATSVSLTLTGSPNASISRTAGSGGAVTNLTSPDGTIAVGGTAPALTLEVDPNLTLLTLTFAAHGDINFALGSQIYEDPTEGLLLLSTLGGGIDAAGGVLNLLSPAADLTAESGDGTNAGSILQLNGAGINQSIYEAVTNTTVAFFSSNRQSSNLIDSSNSSEAQIGTALVTGGTIIGTYVPSVGIGNVTTTIKNTNIKLVGAVTENGLPLARTPLFSFQGYGDSYVSGQGSTNPLLGSSFAQISKTIPSVPAVNYGVGGTTSDTINFSVWTLVQPSPQQPSAYILDGGNNDRGSCGTTTACLTNFKEEVSSSLSRLTIPNQERVMGSSCTQTAGTWTADNGLYTLPAPFYYLNPGTAMSASGSGAILTCTVTSRSASTKVGLNFQVTNAQTGTFTVTVDGVPQIDQCSGTTTFTSAPCAGQNLLTLATTIFRQEFTGTPGTTHTCAVTTTNAAKVNVTACDAITPAPQANSNYVVVYGPAVIFDAGGTYDAVIAAVANQFTTDGARVVFGDLQSTTNPGPGVNNTTDIATTATASCSASVSANHPNDVCGQFHLAQTVVNAAKAAGWNIFGTPQSSGGGFDSTTIAGQNVGTGAGVASFYGASGSRATFGYDPRGSAFIAGSNGHGIDFYCSSTTLFTNGLCGGYTPASVPWTAQGTAIASATTIAPTAAGIFHVTGTTPIVTITPPSGCTTSAIDCELKLIPDAIGSTTTGGNIVLGTTFVVGKLLIEVYDPATTRWYPSY